MLAHRGITMHFESTNKNVYSHNHRYIMHRQRAVITPSSHHKLLTVRMIINIPGARSIKGIIEIMI